MNRLIESLHTLGIESLSEMQRAVIEKSKYKHNLLLLSPTGSGKTIAYMLPLIANLKTESKELQAVVILPTRELAQQSNQVFNELTKASQLTLHSACLHGGRSTMIEHKQLNSAAPQVVFATPGRLLDHLEKGNLSASNVERLIVDEFDKCLELGFLDEIQAIFTFLPKVSHTTLLSATEDLKNVNPEELFNTKFHTMDFTHDTSESYTLSVVKSEEKDKLPCLKQVLITLLRNNEKMANIIVFAAHRESVNRISKYLKEEGFDCMAYHGGMEQEEREKNLFLFRSKVTRVLIATDLAARGLDIEHVNTIIHYHLPLDINTFTHRNGRSTRWENEGEVLLLCGPTENVPDFLHTPLTPFTLSNDSLPRHHSGEFTPLYIGRGKADKLSKGDVVGFLCKKGGLKSSDIGLIVSKPHATYLTVRTEKAKQMFKLIQGEKIKGMKTIIEKMHAY